MSRVKRSVHARKKRRATLERAKGYRGKKHSSYKQAKEQLLKSDTYAYRDRRNRGRDESGLFVAEGEDLVEAAAAGGWDPEVLLVAGEDVEPELLDRVSSLGSGSRVVGVYRQRWAEPGGALSLYLHGVGDPGNVGTAIRSAHALCDGPVVLGPGCADPFSPKAVRAAMGSLFARPPARAEWGELRGFRLALHGRAEAALSDLATQVKPPVVLCVGAEREGCLLYTSPSPRDGLLS